MWDTRTVNDMMARKIADTGEKRMLLRRIIVYGIVFFLLAIAQCSFFSKLKPFGATPNIVLGAICGVIMLDNKHAAAVCAVAFGYILDAIGAIPPSFAPLFYLVCVAVLSALAEKMMPRFISFAVLMIPASLLNAAYTYINIRSITGEFRFIPSMIFPEMLSTFVFCLPMYFIIKLCMIPIINKQ